MRIIDLLNKIANGEEVPDYIRYRDISKHKEDIMMVCKENIIYKLDQCIVDLNDEVEILEEPKGIPEKLRTWYSVEEHQSLKQNCEFANCNFETMYEKINEIIDYLESKGE